MGAAIEIARFTVKEGAEEAFLADRPAFVEAIRRRYPSHRDAYLVKLDERVWMDVVLWGDRAEAEAAAEGAYAFPELVPWLEYIDEMIGFEYADVHQIAPGP